MAYTKYGSNGHDHSGSSLSSSPPAMMNGSKKENIHSETVRQMYMWKN
jgi:hypothetical protein